MTIEEAIEKVGRQIGAQSIALSILVGSLHQQGVINGRAIAQSLRLAGMGDDEVERQLVETADLICRIIDQDDAGSNATLKPVD